MDTTGDIPNDFVAQFHNLTGDTIGERKREFFKLVKNPGLFSTQQQIDDAINLKPRTYLESLFKVDLLIYLKRTTELTEILKEGNEVFISKILKQPWYFREAFNDMDAQSFTNHFVPCMSYAMRMKLLKRISSCWNEEKIDALFDALCERYGLHVAVSILQNCSKPRIQEVLNENELNLRPNQVKNLFDRDPSLFKLYVERQLEKRVYEESKVLYHVAIKCPTLLLELEKDKKVEIYNIGRRTSKRFVALVKEDIPKDIDRYTRLLKKSVIVRRLGNEFEALYVTLFPKRIDDIDIFNSCNELLRLYPKNRRWDLFAKTFSKVFPNNSINEAFSKFSEGLFLHFNPSREIIQKWADIKYKEDKKWGDTYLKYFEPSKAIPLIKEKINVISDTANRYTAVMLLIQTCGQNKDMKALEDVLKYICTRHRNEDANFRSELYNTISASFKLETLNETHWKYINEQIKISSIRKEIWFWTVGKFLIRHLEFLLKNCKDHNTAIIDYINVIVEHNYNKFDLTLDNPPIEKQIYIAICKQLPEVVKVDSEHYESVYRNLITDIINFSISQPDHFISLADFPYLVAFIHKSLNKTEGFSEDIYFIDTVLSYNACHKNPIPIENSTLLQLITLSTEETKSLFSSAEEMITKKSRSNFENEVLKLYFEKLIDYCPSTKTVHWFMRNEPRTLQPYFDKVIENSLKIKGLFKGQQLRLYSHFDYDRKVCEFYKAKLCEEECDEKVFVVKSLILLLPTTDFEKVVDYLLPKKPKLDLEDEEMQKLYKLQCELAKNLHKVQEPSIILPFVMKFCVGDYLQSALPSLYGVFYKSAENLLYPYVDELSKRGAISVKKHALYLSCEVLDKKTVLDLLKTPKQGDASIQKHQFSATLKYFLKNPSQDLLARVVENMVAIDKKDTETLDKLKDIKVPRKYRSLYIEKCWRFFEDLEKSDVEVKDYLEELLQSIDIDVLKSLSPKFVIDIITKYLPVQGEQCLTGIEEFANKVLEHRETERADNFEVVFKILLKMRKTKVRCFFSAFIKNPNDMNRAYANIFEDYWKKHFTITDTFEEHIDLKLLNIHLDCTGNLKLHAERVVECLGQLVSEYGLHVFRIFKDALSEFMSHQDSKDKYLIYHNILVHKLTPNTCILVLQLIDSVTENTAESFEVFQNIMRLLGTVQDTIVQVYYKACLVNNRLEEFY